MAPPERNLKSHGWNFLFHHHKMGNGENPFWVMIEYIEEDSGKGILGLTGRTEACDGESHLYNLI